MEVDRYRNELAQQLSKYFRVNQIKATIVPPKQITGPMLKSMIVYCYEFYINESERYFTFAVELNNQVLFTRPKEGIREYLTPLIRHWDFAFQLTGDVYNHKDVVGKLIEGKINQICRNTMDQVFYKEFNEQDLSYWFGFKVTQHHKESLSFDSEVELIIKRDTKLDTESYRGSFKDGNPGSFKNKRGETISMREIARG